MSKIKINLWSNCKKEEKENLSHIFDIAQKEVPLKIQFLPNKINKQKDHCQKKEEKSLNCIFYLFLTTVKGFEKTKI